MKKDKNIGTYGDQAPSLKEFLLVLLVIGILIFLSWLAYYKLNWYH